MSSFFVDGDIGRPLVCSLMPAHAFISTTRVPRLFSLVESVLWFRCYAQIITPTIQTVAILVIYKRLYADNKPM